MTASRGSAGAAIGLIVLLAFASLAAGATAGISSGAVAATSASPESSAAGTPAAPSATEAASTASITPPPEPLAAAADSAPASSRGAAIVAALNAKGVSSRDVFLPDFAAADPGRSSGGHVNLTYTTAPAPYGIGDFGLRNVSGVLTPYITQTTSLNASFSSSDFSGYSADLSSPDEYGVQLNAVLTNVTLFGQTGYQFWTQNVFEYVPSNSTLQFVSNIWNFSSPGAELTCNVFFAAGGFNECPEFYYGLSAPIPAAYPFSVRLWLNTTMDQGRNEVLFNYTVSSALGDYAGGYDYAIFNSTAPGSSVTAPPAAFEANGFADNPLGLPDDFELTLGGPGGGSNFDLFASDATYLTLTYLNASSGTYRTVDSAYNVGGDTGETSVGVNSAWAQFAGCSNCAELNAGPSFQYGFWNVSNGPPEEAFGTQPRVALHVDPMTAFVFVAPGLDVENMSAYQWAPVNLLGATAGIVLPLGNYSTWVLASEYDPMSGTFELSAACVPCDDSIALAHDSTVGVYTPLWAFNETAVAYLSSGVDGFGNDQLYNNQYGLIGEVPCISLVGCNYFPWFGAFNDWMFPVFPGVFLYDVDRVSLSSPPSFETDFPTGPSFQAAIDYYGLPESNDLQIVVYDSTDVSLLGGTIGGWWPAATYFGPSQSIANVQFWNTSSSTIYGVDFQTGGMALFLYGGTDNYISSNSFTTLIPGSANPYATVAAYFGSVGLVDTDWGDAYLYGAAAWTACAVCDVVDNNLFDTTITATQLYGDPYTGLAPNQYPYAFSQAYNGPYTPGTTNIVGGDYLGGNYWWDYGLYWNPYDSLPYTGLNPLPYLEFEDPLAYICETFVTYCDGGGGDYYPLSYSPIYSVTFEENGLPAGTEWGVGTPVNGSGTPLGDLETGTVVNETAAPGSVTLADPAGTYSYLPTSNDPAYAAADGTFEIVNQSLVLEVTFTLAFSLNVTESGLPAGTAWSVSVTSDTTSGASSGTTPYLTIGGLLAGTYDWSTVTAGAFAPDPASGTVTISGNATLALVFVAEHSLTVTETGLPSGATWYFAYQSASGYSGFVTISSSTATIPDLPAVSYAWNVVAGGFVGTPAYGSVTLSGDTVITVAFAASDATGTVSGTIQPSSGSLAIDGTAVAVSSGGAFSATVSVGVHSIEVTAAGYVPYFNNVSVSAGGTTQLAIALTSSGPSSGHSGIGTLGWVVIAALAVVVAILVVLTLLFARRGRTPPPVVPFAVAGGPPAAPPPAAPAAAPSDAPPPAWQEPPPPPPSPGA